MREIKDNKQRCVFCDTFKDFSEFKKRKDRPFGINSKCKECCKEQNNQQTKKWREANPEKSKEISKKSYENNREIVLEKNKKYREDNRKKIKEYFRERYNNDKEYRLKKLEYWKNNDRTEITRRQYLKNKDNPDFKINKNISSGIRKSLHSRKNGRHWEDLVGYTLKDLMEHLEKQFETTMTWENYGEWHIDHKTPKSWFIFESYEDEAFKKCWALENLQPLWAKDNISKGNRFSS